MKYFKHPEMQRLSRVFTKVDKFGNQAFYYLDADGFYRITKQDAKTSIKNGATVLQLPKEGGE